MTSELSNLVLTEGLQVSAAGMLDSQDERSGRLWTTPYWDSEGGDAVVGGDVEVTFANSSNILKNRQFVSLVGIWRNGAIEAAEGQVVKTPPPVEVICNRYPESSSNLGDEQRQALIMEAMENAESPVLGFGGSKSALMMQVLYVTRRLADWHAKLTQIPCEIYVSITPWAVEVPESANSRRGR